MVRIAMLIGSVVLFPTFANARIDCRTATGVVVERSSADVDCSKIDDCQLVHCTKAATEAKRQTATAEVKRQFMHRTFMAVRQQLSDASAHVARPVTHKHKRTVAPAPKCVPYGDDPKMCAPQRQGWQWQPMLMTDPTIPTRNWAGGDGSAGN